MPSNEQRAKAFDAVSSELDYQAKAWSTQSSEDVLSVGEEILVMEEYLLKARSAWQQSYDPKESEALEIIRKISAIGIRCMANHGAIPRKPAA